MKELKSDKKLKALLVVMLTTASATEDVKKALELGANDYILTPMKFSDFVEKVGKIGHYWAFISDSDSGISLNR